MSKISNSAQRDNSGNPQNEVSHLTVSIFQYYFDEQVKPFLGQLDRKNKRLLKLQLELKKLDPSERSEKDQKQIKWLKSEIRDSYQAFVAMDELKSIYTDHYQQLHDRYLRMKDFAEKQFYRAESLFDLWGKSQSKLGATESLLNCLTDKERKDLESRKAEKRLNRLVRLFVEDERPVSTMLKARKASRKQFKAVEA